MHTVWQKMGGQFTPDYMGIARSLNNHGAELVNDGLLIRVTAFSGNTANVDIQDLKAREMNAARLAKSQAIKTSKSRQNLYDQFDNIGRYQRQTYSFPQSPSVVAQQPQTQEFAVGSDGQRYTAENFNFLNEE
jgi:hypothetical protein